MDCPYLPWARLGVALNKLYTHVDFRSVVCDKVSFLSSQIVRKLLWIDGRKSVSP